METVTKAGRLRDALMTLWREHQASGMLPTSARFLYYELIARGVLSKERTGARRTDQDMIDQLTKLREDGEIPWTDIVDETRTVADYTGEPTVKAGLLSVLEQVRLDPWHGNAPMVVTESRSLAGVLRSIAYDYRVQIASTNGQAGGFLRTQIAPRLHEGSHTLYFGDLDFSGGHIEANTRSVLEQVGEELAWERLAVTEEQVSAYGLTKIPKHDKRDGKNHDAVETEALGQERIVEMLRNRLDELLPEGLETVLECEKRQRRALRRTLNFERKN